MSRAVTHTWFFFGDSLTLGVNDDRMPGGWVSRLVLLGKMAGLYRFPPATFYNLGARRQSTADLARRWRQEVTCRQMPGMMPRLLFCTGVVDMAAPGGGQPLEQDNSLRCLREILTEAASLAPTLVVSPPPVADPAACRRIAQLSAAQAVLCADMGLSFADIHAMLAASPDYMDDLSDSLHPGPKGCAMMAELLLAQTSMRDFLRTDMDEKEY
ncbi:GDSL-type esterase/lipase family protein [Desulfovibrio sp. SGI.169]|uniref:GDSL-type esterase/lipase family protein n=1 Tax=Desulfovibrio sp. SGI.169 TaxID=3420561 RepID=UPI003D0200C2